MVASSFFLISLYILICFVRIILLLDCTYSVSSVYSFTVSCGGCMLLELSVLFSGMELERIITIPNLHLLCCPHDA